ncbi:hypothetical protein M0805_006370 [Coniferiporia weirii]|nr:hypothetical protein M0805_006370 [Coniferiporia weirii]
MFKYTLLAIATLAAVPQALAVCSSGQIAIGDQYLSSAGAVATIWANDRGVIDARANNNADICGGYNDGSNVICNAGTETPNSAQTPDGSNWGSCTSVSGQTCSFDSPVLFCCSPA